MSLRATFSIIDNIIKMRQLKLLVAAMVFGLLLSSCTGSSPKKDPNHIKVGITSGPEREIAETARKVAKEKYNLDVELVTFNDYVMPNEGLNNGDIDANAFQHVPYLDEQSRQRGYKLAVVGNTFLYPIVAYSKKIKNVSELQKRSTVVIPNDPTNGGRSLLLLESAGLITLKENVGLSPKVTDIVANPKQLRILEIEAPQLPRVLDDKEVVVAVINNNFAAQAGLKAEEYGILTENRDSPYVNVIVAREDNKGVGKVKNFVKAYQSDEVLQTAKEIFHDGAIKGW